MSEDSKNKLDFSVHHQNLVVDGKPTHMEREDDKMAGESNVQMIMAKHRGTIKLEVEKAKAKLEAEYESNGKLMDHQITKVLQVMVKKAPELKSHVLLIKKLLGNYSLETKNQK